MARCREIEAECTRALNDMIARNNQDQLDAQVSELDGKAPEAAHAVSKARAALRPLRADHGEQVAKALDEHCAQAATHGRSTYWKHCARR